MEAEVLATSPDRETPNVDVTRRPTPNAVSLQILAYRAGVGLRRAVEAPARTKLRP